jgi:hypothetical protein
VREKRLRAIAKRRRSASSTGDDKGSARSTSGETSLPILTVLMAPDFRLVDR